MRGVELDAPGSIGERRGAVRSIWVETIDSLGLRSFDDLRARFEEARFWEARGEAHTEPGIAANSSGPSITIDGMTTGAAKHAVGEWLAREGVGRPTVTFKLRDWLFSRQRYWGEPFPIVYDEWGRAHALPEKMLPVLLPDLEDFRPESSDDPDAPPRPPLARASAWTTVELDLGDGKRTYTRETNTMPNWAGSCWYYLRYLDPTNQNALVGKDVDSYWMGGTSGKIGGVDLYVGGVEHAVLHLLYARFWHKVLFDLGHVSTAEPFQTLFNQGYIQAFAFKDARGVYVDAFEVRLPDGALAMEHQDKPGPYTYSGEPVTREYGKMGKSLKNAVAPDEICAHYGCDTMRIYEMAMGPLEASKPWNTRDIAGSFRFLQRVWRNLIDEQTGLSRVTQDAPTRATLRVLHKTIIGVRRDMEKLGFNTVVSKLIELNNHLSELPAVPLEAARAMILMLAPHAPHVSEELWHRVVRGGTPDEREARETIVHEAYPIADESLARDDEVEIPVSVLGKLRSKIVVPAGSSAVVIEAAARADVKIAELIAGKEIKKVIVVPGKMVNFVV
jgi:leucyl-tRNA synthetase